MTPRVEQMRIGKADPFYGMLDGFCFASKNLYNQALYRVRQNYCIGRGYLNYNSIDASFKTDGREQNTPAINGMNNADYRNMPTAASAQQTLILHHRNWISFFTATKEYKKHPDNFTGKPRMPGYLDKIQGRQVVALPGQSLSLNGGYIKFPATFKGFTVKFRHNATVLQVRFVPSNSFITVEVVYHVDEEDPKADNGRYFGIDLGINNFATIASNVMPPLIINGAPLKSINQHYNKLTAHYRSIETQLRPQVSRTGATYCKQTNRLLKLTTKRNTRVKDAMHKISRYIVDLAVANDITKIIVGKNVGWKQEVNLGRRTNQNFVQLPHTQFVDMLTYKARAKGIKVITKEESYTSKTSHLDMEQPKKQKQYKGTREHRGLFRTANGTKVNADVNGAAQIMRKAIPTIAAYGLSGGENPVKVDAA